MLLNRVLWLFMQMMSRMKSAITKASKVDYGLLIQYNFGIRLNMVNVGYLCIIPCNAMTLITRYSRLGYSKI